MTAERIPRRVHMEMFGRVADTGRGYDIWLITALTESVVLSVYLTGPGSGADNFEIQTG